MGAPGDDGGIDAVGGEEGEDVAFAPVVNCLQAFAKGKGAFFDLSVGVGALCVGILVYDFWLLVPSFFLLVT